MPKLSATSGQDPDAITRVDITPETIRNMRCNACKAIDAAPGSCRHVPCEDLEDLLRKMRGNREVVAQKASGPKTPRTTTPKAKRAMPDEDEEVHL